jgi:uncharacterized membrane protein YecN with MAPEG domain
LPIPSPGPSQRDARNRLYAALVAVLFLALSRRVIVVRRAAQVTMGDGGDRGSCVRFAPANCAEYAPIGIILIGLAESLSVPVLILHALGLGGRRAGIHAYGSPGTGEPFGSG